MRAGLISAAALTLALPALWASSGGRAAAAEGPGFTTTPATVAAGDTVTLRASGCTGPATASAPGLFGTVALGPGGGPRQSATVTVGRHAEPGERYDVTFGCDAGQGTVPLAVADRDAVAPGALRTGLGGVTDPGSVKAVAAGALVGATGLVLVRRRRTAHR